MAKLPSYKFGTNPFPADYKVIRSVTLQCTDLSGNNNKFYQMELHEAGGQHRVYSCYGRTGKNGVREERMPSSEHEANACFDAIVHEKTTRKRERYTEVKVATTARGSEVGRQMLHSDDIKKDKIQIQGNVAVAAGPKLSPSVVRLVERLYAEAGQTVRGQLNASLQTTAENPLGTLTLGQIEAGKQVLDEVNSVLVGRPNLVGSIDRRLIELSNQFYSAIPQSIPMRPRDSVGADRWLRTYTLNNPTLLDEKRDLLDLLSDVQGMASGFETEDVSKKYLEIGADIEEADAADKKRIADLVHGTQSRNHYWKLSVKNVWRIGIKAQAPYEKTMQQVGNIQELFHGSRAANILGIAKKGLLLRPPGVYVTGSMFGSGLYFADQSTKSSQYATARYGGTRGYGDTYFMFVTDVALGSVKEYQHAQPSLTRAPQGYDSVKGVAGPSLVHNEFIIYNLKQHVMRYLVEFSSTGY